MPLLILFFVGAWFVWGDPPKTVANWFWALLMVAEPLFVQWLLILVMLASLGGTMSVELK